ncbi:MAG: alpha-D-ribose 1-methylphosphonate 5-triphosphate diphosphatase [Oscillospiraceae bacterium]|nr:alpha-D-ribose 1-methylphosphonate 5-triphosphate diphosphatase [Oscillospiraceae bacterium]
MRLNIVNADVVLPEGIIKNSCVAIEDGIISKIGGNASRGAALDANGAYLLPGMIDIHSDHVEQIIEPRAGSVMDIPFALREQEKQLVNNGITTMYHSLAMWKPAIRAMRRKAAREEDFLEQIIRAVINTKNSPCLITHMLHIRLDITNFEAIPRLRDMIVGGNVSLLSFMDHTPGQGQYRDLEPFKAAIKANNPELSDAEIEERLEQRMQVEKIPMETLVDISKLAQSKGISIASHDDDSVAKVNFAKNTLNASISEFPVEIGTARHAKKVGMKTLGGAPNVLLGKSHSGNMSATEGVLDKSISMLCSDYYPSSMLEAVFSLHRKSQIPLHECVNLVTSEPAKAVGIWETAGSVEEGKRADLLLVDASGGHPAITTVITEGSVTSTLNYSKKRNI